MARPISYDPSAALERAMDLFWSRGYGAVSVDDVVQGTGLNRHSLYSNYGNKFGLLRAALDQYIETAVDKIRAILAGPGTAGERIAAFMALRSRDCPDPFWRSMHDRGCLAIRIASELRPSHPEIFAEIAEVEERMLALVADVVREGQQAGEFRRDREPAQLATVIYGGFLAMLCFTPDDDLAGAFLSVLH